MPLNGLRWSRNSGSANCDMPQSAVFGRPGGGELDENITCAKFAYMGTDQDQTYETNSAHQGQGACPCWVSSVPTWGKHRARFPKIYCACPWLIFLFSAN